jgi:hypothetical protein
MKRILVLIFVLGLTGSALYTTEARAQDDGRGETSIYPACTSSQCQTCNNNGKKCLWADNDCYCV